MQAVVLCYHAVSPSWQATLSLSPEALERQLSWLRRHGWRGANFTDVVRGKSAARTVAVTFDDAFASVFELARPIMAELGLPGTVFVPTAFPSTQGPLSWSGVDHWAATEHAAEMRCMSWEMIAELAQEGWEIGSHTRTHPRLTALGDEALAAELCVSRHELGERLGRPCASLAYPYGDVDARVIAAAADAGYTAAGALSSGLAALGPLQWPRIGIYQGDTFARFALKLARPMRALRASPLWPQGRGS